MSEGSRHFDEKSAVFQALHKIVAKLDELSIPYAIVGGMALFRHGFRRFTEDVDILVTRDQLRVIHEKLAGLGYLPPFEKSRHLRDTEFGVKIEFIVTGDFPGDGKKKPVAFPDPNDVAVDLDGIRYIGLPHLVELKLASGMTNPGRLKDLADVLELIQHLNLPFGFENQLHEFVRGKYRELWKQGRQRFVAIWRDERLTPDVNSIEDMVELLPEKTDELTRMRDDGIVLADNGQSGYATLVIDDALIAEKYGMIEESEYWDEYED